MKEKIHKHYKVYFDNEYETDNQFSNRLLLRIFKKNQLYGFIEKGIPYLYAYEKDGKLYELLTNKEINGRKVPMNKLSIYTEINNLGMSRFLILYNLLEYIFDIDNHDIKPEEITSMEEASEDRAIQFDAYQKGLTTINPYDINQVNNFNVNKKLVKCKK